MNKKILLNSDPRYRVNIKMQACSVHITTSNFSEAKDIGTALVQKKLAACVNIVKDIHSIYEWQGKVQADTECLLIAKSRPEIFEPLKAEVLSRHSYTCPCIVMLPIEAGHLDFIQWVREQTPARQN